MRRSTFFKSLMALLLLGYMPNTSAAVHEEGVKLFADNFEYPEGELVSNGAWKDYSYFFGGGDDPVMIVEGGLTYPGYQPTALGNSVQLKTNGKDVTASFPSTDGAIYASMLVNVTAAPADGDFIFSFADKYNGSTDGFGKLHIKNVDGKLAFGVTRKSLSNDATYTEAAYELNTTYLLVAKYTQAGADSKMELIVNPDITGSEPAFTVESMTGGEAGTPISGINLFQGRGLGNDVRLDAIRVATSWESLFSNSQVAKVPEIIVPTSLYIGSFSAGSKPVVTTLNVKAKNLEQDITVSFSTDGYFTIPSATISKEAAQGADGFDLVITLNPKNGEVLKDKLVFTSGEATSTVNLNWWYTMPDPELEVNDIATLQQVTKEGYYTLINPVTITEIGKVSSYDIYTFEDASGSFSVTDIKKILANRVKEGSELTNLRIRVQAEPESPTFVPIFSLAESSELVINTPRSDFKLFRDNIDYPIGKLDGNGDWEEVIYQIDPEGTDPINIVAEALTYPGYQDEATGNAIELKAVGNDAKATFSEIDQTLYASMLVNVKTASPTGDFFFAFSSTYDGGYAGAGRVFVKAVDGKIAFGTSLSTPAEGATFTDAVYDLNTTYLIVVKYSRLPEFDDDHVDIFVNPDITAEPTDFVTNKEGFEAYGVFNGINIYQGDNTGNHLILDAIHVANSWEALFDDSEVVHLPEVHFYTITEQGDEWETSQIEMGAMEQGQEKLVSNYRIKAKNLQSDLVLKCKTEGYFTLNATTITKEDAQKEEGFVLTITLDPKDNKVTKDTLSITTKLVNIDIPIGWNYIAIINAENVSKLKDVTGASRYTLINEVKISDIKTVQDEYGGESKIYTLEDKSGTLEVKFDDGGVMPLSESTISNIKKGDTVKNLVVEVRNNSWEDPNLFIPEYVIITSPDLIIIPEGINNLISDTITGYSNGKFIAEGATNIRVYDANGKELSNINAQSINMEQLIGKMFIIQYTDSLGNLHTVKVIK